MLAALSYATSFLRERYLLQEALGSSILDEAVAAYAIASVIGNVYAISLGLLWIDGRRIPRWADAFLGYAIAAALAAMVSPVAGGALLLASLVGGYEYSRQKSVFRSRQPQVLAAAVVAPAGTAAFWLAFGVDSLPLIIGGYAAGYSIQTLASWWSGREASPGPAALHALTTASIAWPIAWASVTLLNTYLDRLMMLFAGRGWAGAAAFSLNIAQAATLVVVGPLSTEAVAGRLRNQPSTFVLVVAAVCTVAVVALTPVVLPVLISGGLVEGARYEQVRDLAMIYMASIPAAGYWSFRARALQTGAHAWRPMALVVGVMTATHVLISAAGLAANQPLIVAIGWTVSCYLGAALVVTDWSIRRNVRREALRAGTD